jgi:hypothetical protein
MKEDGMGGACSTHRRDNKCILCERPEDHSEDQDIDGRIILKCILRK